MHIPHIGETVLVHHKDCFSNGAVTVPAIVQQVVFSGDEHRAPLLNIIAFPPLALPKNLNSVQWFAAAPLIPDEHFVGAWPRNTHHAHVGEPDNSGDCA